MAFACCLSLPYQVLKLSYSIPHLYQLKTAPLTVNVGYLNLVLVAFDSTPFVNKQTVSKNIRVIIIIWINAHGQSKPTFQAILKRCS